MLNTQSLSIDSKITQTPGNIVSDMDREKVMLSVSKGKYYNLGELGGMIWELIDQPVVITDIISSLQLEYDVERTECEDQVMDFLNSLHKEGLVNLID